MAENGAEWASYCHGNGISDGGYLCIGYAESDWPCGKCTAQNELHNSGGFVETDTDNFPVVLICYRGEKAIPILNVRMDSITVRESTIPGYVNVEYEGYGNDVTGTVPMVDYYTTEYQG